MKLTTFTDYGLRVLIFLAAQPGRRATISEVAGAYQVSGNHLVLARILFIPQGERAAA